MSIVRTEWLKMKKYPAFWWIIALTALSYPGINFIFYGSYKELLSKENTAGRLAKMYIGNPFAFPESWHSVAFFSSVFVFIPAVVVIMFITNEYTYKTHRQNIIDGWSRNTFMRSKLIDVLIISLLITLLYMIVAFIIGTINVTSITTTADRWSQFYYTGLFALQTFAQLSIAFLIGFLVRKAFIALGIFLFYFVILEPIAVALLREYSNDEGRFLPIDVSDRLVPIPAFLGKLDYESYQKALQVVNIHIVYTLILVVIVWGICFWVNSRRDF